MTIFVIDEQDYDKKMDRALQGIAIRFQESLKDKLSQEHGKHTGIGQSSIIARVVSDGIEVSMLERMKFVEFGTPPHIAPIEPLKDWARSKLGSEDLAWALRESIKQRGTMPHPFIRPTVSNDLPKIIREEITLAFSQ